MEKKVGVFICGGCGISDSVDVEKLADMAKKEYKVPALVHPCLCNAEGIARVRNEMAEGVDEFKSMVDQLQSQKAHKQYHMIQQMNTQLDVADGELLHAPIWFARYDHKGSKIVLVMDANSGAVVNSVGL